MNLPSWAIVGLALTGTLAFRGTCKYFAPRAHVEASEVLDPAPVRPACYWVPLTKGCPVPEWRK